MLDKKVGYMLVPIFNSRKDHIEPSEQNEAVNTKENILLKVLKILAKMLLLVACLYFFICSLDIMATGGRLIAGKSAGAIFKNSTLLKNPIVGLMLGILVTVIMQSSSTTTSIIVGLVAASIIEVEYAIPMIMGANIGTSVTSTIVALTQMGDTEQFERAFSGAVVHDFFNWLTVIVLFVLEVSTGLLYRLSKFTTESFHLTTQNKPPKLLKALTQPLTKMIIQVDKKVLKGWSLNQPEFAHVDSLLKKACKRTVATFSVDQPEGSEELVNATKVEKYACGYVFAETGLSDSTIGLILLFLSIFTLVICLVTLVKILNSLLKERLAETITKVINSDIPYLPWLTGYLMIIFGAFVTFLVQSSSVFTSTLTPLVGAGLLTLERVYPLTLGSNIGTTTTGLLAALTADSSKLAATLQISLCHLYFNVIGILIFYPIPFLRWPIPLARKFGKKVAKHRWFSLVYLALTFVVIPLYVFGLSLMDNIALYIGVTVPSFIAVVAIIINVLQENKPDWLPNILKNWDFLPIWLHSLKPYDKFFPSLNCNCKNKEDAFSVHDLPMTVRD